MSDIQTFFDTLFDPADLIELRFLPPMKTKSNQWYWYGGMIANDWDSIEARNKKQDCYFGVNPRQERRGTADAITICRVVFADFDHTTPDAVLKTIEAAKLPAPTILVNSGHGAHAYWRLEDEIDTQQWRSIQRGLIEILKCDDKIKDAPRIMRLPGTRHVSKHVKGDAPKLCEIVYNSQAVHDIEDIIRHLPETTIDHSDAEPLPDGSCTTLPAWANQFLVSGTGDGDRNSKAFDVACAMSGNGWPKDLAKKKIVAACEQCTPPLGQGEALAAVESAYSKDRSPPAIRCDGPAATAWQLAVPKAEPAPTVMTEEEVEDARVIGEPYTQKTTRTGFSNVLEASDSEGNLITHAKHVEDVTASLHELTGKWPRRAGGMLFVPGDQPAVGDLPKSTAIRRLIKPDELFAWVHSKTSPYWAEAKRCSDMIDGSGRTSIKKSEFFEHLRETVHPAYESAEVLPHEPPAKGVWYAPCIIQRAPRNVLEEFADKMNWQTHLDRSLIVAACLSMFWGGPCGSRPAFVVTSDHGAGAGKTGTVDMICRVAGGRMEMGADETPEAFCKRLLSDQALRQRAVLLDNVKKRVDSQGIEAMITADEISGHRMYAGHATRPNRITWFITANSPKLSHDLSERSYNIQIGAQRTDAPWRASLESWIDDNRAALISSAMGILAGPDVCEITTRDRWSAWQSAVLAKVERGNEIADRMAERRRAMDADSDDADEIAWVVRGLLRINGCPPDSSYAFFSRRALADAYNVWSGENDKSRRWATTFIGNRIGNGALKRLKETKQRGERGYAWTGEDLSGPKDRFDMHLSDIPANLTVSDMQPPAGGDGYE